MFRVIDKETGMFLRDDFDFDAEKEIGLEVEPAQGFYLPKWDGEKWVEGLTKAEIEDIKAEAPKELTPEERIVEMEAEIARLKSELNVQ
jgi:hypothetical protein